MNYEEVSHIFLIQKPADLRKGADFLLDFVAENTDINPYDSDNICFFINKRHNLIKGVQYDLGRSSLHWERIPSGTYKWSRFCLEPVTEIDPESFSCLLRSWIK